MAQIEGKTNEHQRTENWHLSRLGKFSASQFYRLMTEPKLKYDKDNGNLSNGALSYVLECVAEKITGKKAKEDFSSKATEYGVIMEPIAKGIYNAVFDVEIKDTDYISLDEYSGGSPDGLIGHNGLIEIKCPYTITEHLNHYINDLRDKPEYFWQIVGYLLITGREWIDFVSYNPEYPARLQLIRKRYLASDLKQEMDNLKNKLAKASIKYKEILEKLK